MHSVLVRVFRIVLIGLVAVVLGIGLLQMAGVPVINTYVTVQTSSSSASETNEMIHLSLEGMTDTSVESVVIYHEPSAQAFAAKLADQLHDNLHSIEDEFGFEGLGIKVGLFYRGSHDSSSRYRLRAPGQVIPLFVSKTWSHLADADDRFRKQQYWVLPHEAVETQIAQAAYFIDSRTRWIGDGLAELGAFHVAHRQAPDIACELINGRVEQVRGLIQAGNQRYSLVEDFPVRSTGDDWTDLERAGYGVAFAFWSEITRQYGRKSVQDFWEDFRSHFRLCLLSWCIIGPDSRNAARLLSQQTDEPIWSAIQDVRLTHVVSVLERTRMVILGKCD